MGICLDVTLAGLVEESHGLLSIWVWVAYDAHTLGKLYHIQLLESPTHAVRLCSHVWGVVNVAVETKANATTPTMLINYANTLEPWVSKS